MKIRLKTTLAVFIIISIFACSENEELSKTTAMQKEQTALEIDSVLTEKIGGIDQVLKIITKDNTFPVLLYLSGGPGSSIMDRSNILTNKLKNKFTIVLWDQRGVGKTLELNSSNTPPTLQQMQNDTYEVIELILEKFDKKKIYLAGLSWGNVLGFEIVKNHPQLLHCYFACSPIVNQLESDKRLLSKLVEIYKLKENSTALAELSSIQIPYTRKEDLFYSRKWLFHMEGDEFATTNEFRDNFMKWCDTWFPVWQETMKINLHNSLKDIKCPVYFFVGQQDVLTSFDVSKEYFKIINAPSKDMYVFPGVRHNFPEEFLNQLQDIMIEKINSNTSVSKT